MVRQVLSCKQSTQETCWALYLGLEDYVSSLLLHSRFGFQIRYSIDNMFTEQRS